MYKIRKHYLIFTDAGKPIYSRYGDENILAPFFEEFIYRVVIINIFLEANIMSVNKCVLILPIFFAIGNSNFSLNFIAHAHHLYRERHRPPSEFKRLMYAKLFQLCYT